MRADDLEQARAAHSAREWRAARDAYEAAGSLTADDLSAFGDTCWWLGDLDDALDATKRAHDAYLAEGNAARAAMTAIEAGYTLFLQGDEAEGTGWMGRAYGLLSDLPEGVEHGYLAYIEAEAAVGAGDVDAALEAAARAREIARAHNDPSLAAVGVLAAGRALLKAGRVAEGMRLLDEAMVAVVSGRLEPAWAGNVYCNLIAACYEMSDFGRTVEWIEATERWLAQQSAAVVFAGICRVHRVQMMALRGTWDEAEREASGLCEHMTRRNVAVVGESHYQLGELRRLRADLPGAEQAYLAAADHGRDPQPGLALLRLAQGRTKDALASLGAALAAATTDRPMRARLLAARVDAALASGDLDLADEAATELESIASDFKTSGLQVAAKQARGGVMLGRGDAGRALAALRDACARWQQLDAPYECARVRAAMAGAYALLGDHDSAARERDAAVAIFERLGAPSDAERARTAIAPPLPDGLTAREAEVLALLASGKSNRELAQALVLSEKTIARHLSNIYTKIGVSTRTAAAAYAFEHRIASPGDRG